MGKRTPKPRYGGKRRRSGKCEKAKKPPWRKEGKESKMSSPSLSKGSKRGRRVFEARVEKGGKPKKRSRRRNQKNAL